MNVSHTARSLGLFSTALLAALLVAGDASAVDKLVDKILCKHDPSPTGVFRWSEGSTISLDGKKHLMMLVTAIGFGGHDATPGDIVEFLSNDGGLTWTPPEKARVFQKNIGKANIMSPSLLRLDNDNLLFFFMVKHKALVDCGPWMRRSTDNGKTWSEPKTLPYEGYGGLSSDRAYQTSSGRIILPCWVSHDKLGSTHPYCLYSDDRGKTWKKTDLISVPKGTSGRRTDPAGEEPTIIELKDGRLMMFIRVYLKSIYKSYSSDNGTTWSKPVSSGIPGPGAMPTLRRMPDGNILLVWNWAPVEKISGPWPRNHMSTAISTDDGRNFSYLRHLDGSDDFPGKMTMANVAFCEGNVVITYSKSMTKKNAYNWCLQVVPIEWLYEGDKSVVYGEKYLPTLQTKLRALKKKAPANKSASTSLPVPSRIDRPTAEERKQSLAGWGDLVAKCRKDKNLVAAYSFEEGQGKFVFDLSEGANDLALVTIGKQPAWAEGNSGKAMEFDGRGGYLVAPDSRKLRFDSNAFTVEAWIHPTAKKPYSAIVSKEHVFQFALLDGKLQAAVHSPAGGWGSPGWVGQADVPLNRWSKVALTFDGHAMRFYLNDKLVDTALRKAKMSTNTEPLTIGAITHIHESPFVGRIDEVRLWRGVRYGPAASVNCSRPLSAPRRVGKTHQLFIDDGLIESFDGLSRVVNQPVKHHDNPVLTYTKPWEGNCVITWGSVLYEPKEKLFKIWYEVYKKFPPAGERGTLLCYATSRDGICWEKPELGLIPFRGSKANNIVLRESIDALTVFRDPRPTPQSKYLAFWYGVRGEDRGILSARSADGVRWEPIEGVRVKAGDRCSAGYDAARKKFYVITRIPGRGIRTCGLWESVDGVKFEHVGEIAAPDDEDPPQTQFYGMITFPYAGLRLGFLEPFYIPIRKLDTQLMYSRDGHDWRRACDRQVFLPYGPPGSWDQAWVTPSHNPPIRVGDKLYIFYQGRQTLHWGGKPFGHIGSVGLAFLRPDGFVSLEFVEPLPRSAHGYQGTATTAPLLLDGKTLHLNVKARPGTVRVEVLDADGVPAAGFTRDDCQPISMVDSLDHEVKWKANRTLDQLAGKPVRLRFHVQAAKLYSFWME